MGTPEHAIGMLANDVSEMITEVRRQRDDWQRDATRHLATGRTGLAITAYDERGMVHAADTCEAARSELIERWDRERLACLARFSASGPARTMWVRWRRFP